MEAMQHYTDIMKYIAAMVTDETWTREGIRSFRAMVLVNRTFRNIVVDSSWYLRAVKIRFMAQSSPSSLAHNMRVISTAGKRLTRLSLGNVGCKTLKLANRHLDAIAREAPNLTELTLMFAANTFSHKGLLRLTTLQRLVTLVLPIHCHSSTAKAGWPVFPTVRRFGLHGTITNHTLGRLLQRVQPGVHTLQLFRVVNLRPHHLRYIVRAFPHARSLIMNDSPFHHLCDDVMRHAGDWLEQMRGLYIIGAGLFCHTHFVTEFHRIFPHMKSVYVSADMVPHVVRKELSVFVISPARENLHRGHVC